jgi:crotonobetaine/carnitine-CoA ligase
METIGALLTSKAHCHEDRTALIFEGRRLSYRDLETAANRTANALQALGVGPDDHVALMLPNGPDYLACWFALAKLGAVTVALNTQLQGDTLAHLLSRSDSRALILADAFRPAWAAVASRLPGLRVLDWDNPANPGRLAAMCSGMPPELTAPPRVADTRPQILTSTSGTTGMPKLVANSHRAYLRAARDLAAAVQVSAEDRIFTALPLYHANPQVYCVLTALVADAAMALAPRFSAGAFWHEVRACGATAFTYVGAVLPILLTRPPTAADKDHPARKCFGGGAPAEIYDAFSARFGVEVLELYGMSETGTWNTLNRPGQGRSGTVGTARRGFQIRIVDDLDNPLPTGEVGEIVLRPDEPFLMFDGYYNDPAESFACSRNWWFHTGDLGCVDAEGYYHFRGRRKEAIRRGGENISPEAVERAANAHPAVAESAAVGVSDPVLFEDLRLFVVAREGHCLDPRELAGHLAQRLPRFMRPRYIDIVAVLPKSASQKIQRLRLKQEPLAATTCDLTAAPAPPGGRQTPGDDHDQA